MTADPTVLPPAAPSEWEELARDIVRLSAWAKECDNFAERSALETQFQYHTARAKVLREIAERIARLLAVAQRGQEAEALNEYIIGDALRDLAKKYPAESAYGRAAIATRDAFAAWSAARAAPPITETPADA